MSKTSTCKCGGEFQRAVWCSTTIRRVRLRDPVTPKPLQEDCDRTRIVRLSCHAHGRAAVRSSASSCIVHDPFPIDQHRGSLETAYRLTARGKRLVHSAPQRVW